MLKKYNTLHSCHNFPVGSRQAPRGVHIYEMSLLCEKGCSFHYVFMNVSPGLSHYVISGPFY